MSPRLATVAALAAGTLTAATLSLTLAPAASAQPTPRVPDSGQMTPGSSMEQMMRLMTDGGPASDGMAQMMSRSPGMQQMHAQMMQTSATTG